MYLYYKVLDYFIDFFSTSDMHCVDFTHIYIEYEQMSIVIFPDPH